MGSKTGGVSQSRNLYFAWGTFIRADLLFSNGLRGRSPPWGAECVRPRRQILGCNAYRSRSGWPASLASNVRERHWPLCHR